MYMNMNMNTEKENLTYNISYYKRGCIIVIVYRQFMYTYMK